MDSNCEYGVSTLGQQIWGVPPAWWRANNSSL